MVYVACTFGVNCITPESYYAVNNSRYVLNVGRVRSCSNLYNNYFYMFDKLRIYGCGTVLYTELRSDSQGIDLYDAVSKKWGIPVSVQILTHKGRTVDAVNSLAQCIFNS